MKQEEEGVMANNVEEGVVVVGDESRKAKRLHLRWSTICLVHPHLALLSIQIVGGPQNLTILFVFLWWARSKIFLAD